MTSPMPDNSAILFAKTQTAIGGKEKEREITKKRKYKVYLNAVAEVSAWTTVEAESEENAEEIAKEKLKENLSDWNIDTLGDVTVWDIEEECDTDD